MLNSFYFRPRCGCILRNNCTNVLGLAYKGAAILEINKLSGLPLSGHTAYITPWDCHRTSKLNFKDVPRTSEISFVRPKSIPETSKNCQKARPLLTSCMMFAPPTYRKFATCVDWALRTSHFPLAGVLLTAVSSVAHPFDGCVITACICHACWVD